MWLAGHVLTGRPVALKRMLPELATDPEVRKAFLDEGDLGMRLSHPNIVETLGTGAADVARGKEAYLVLELLRGRSLAELMRVTSEDASPIPLAVALTIVRDAARGLHHAHQLVDDVGASLGLVHRDVSPHNVFVCSHGISKILDFGIAKSRAQTHRSDPGTIRGKVSYAAPEQLLGGDIDPRLDVFALGVILHELLTGERLFEGDSQGETVYRVLGSPVPAPEALRANLPLAIGALALRSLQRDRDRRLPSGAALADAIEAVAAVEGITLGDHEVSRFLRRTFPADAERFAADAAAVDAALHAVDEARVLPDVHVQSAKRPAVLRRRRGRLLPIAAAVCVMSLSAFAAMRVARVHREGQGQSMQQSNTPAIRASAPSSVPVEQTPQPLVELHITKVVPAPPPARSPKRHDDLAKGCGVYFSITSGTTTVICDHDAKRVTKGSRHH